MFKAIGKFFKNLLTKEEVLPEEIDVVFDPLDIDQAIKFLNLKENAKEDGENNTPNSDSVNKSYFEERIYQFISTQISTTEQKVNDKILSFDKFIKDIDIKDKFEEAKNLGTHTEHEIESINQESKNELIDSKDKLQKLEKNFKKFQMDNKIGYVPDIPLTLVWPIGILIGILLIESILNGVFFAKASALGLLGGIMYAFLVAFVNIAISWGLGRSICNKNHIKKRLQTLGLMAIGGVMVWLTTYNLFVAHYRQQLDIDIKNAGTLAATAFFQSPFALNDFQPWVLFFVGIVFGTAACIDGYYWDDPYPGYGKLYRRRELAKEDCFEEQGETVDRVENLKIKRLDEFTKMQSDVKSDVNHLNEVIAQKKTLVKNLPNHVQQIESNYKIMILKYREINEANRDTDPPSHWREEVATPDHEIIDVNMENDFIKLKKQEELKDEFVEMVEQIKNTIIDLYNKAIQNISNLDFKNNNK